MKTEHLLLLEQDEAYTPDPWWVRDSNNGDIEDGVSDKQCNHEH